LQFEDEVGQVPGCVPECEWDELFHDAVEHVKPVLHVQAGPLSAGWTVSFRCGAGCYVIDYLQAVSA